MSSTKCLRCEKSQPKADDAVLCAEPGCLNAAVWDNLCVRHLDHNVVATAHDADADDAIDTKCEDCGSSALGPGDADCVNCDCGAIVCSACCEAYEGESYCRGCAFGKLRARIAELVIERDRLAGLLDAKDAALVRAIASADQVRMACTGFAAAHEANIRTDERARTERAIAAKCKARAEGLTETARKARAAGRDTVASCRQSDAETLYAVARWASESDYEKGAP